MPKIRENKIREHRIDMAIVVDAYNELERAMSWYYYLDNEMHLPFLARCITKRTTSPLKIGDKVEVVGMPPEEECEHDMFVMILWDNERLAVPLSQLKVVRSDSQTRRAVEDWHYWVNRGYQF